MKASKKCLDLIKEFESLRLMAYRCTSDVLTIGYGHTKGVKEGMTISRDKADEFLVSDVADVERQLINSLPNVVLSQNQYDALVSLVFNIGIGNFNSSTIKKKIIANVNDPDIKYQFSRWKFSRGKIANGLVRRREIESELYFS